MWPLVTLGVSLSPCFTEVLTCFWRCSQEAQRWGKGDVYVISSSPSSSCSGSDALRGEEGGRQSGSYYLAGTVIVISHWLPLNLPAFLKELSFLSTV